ncbi:hypothetical protein Psta_0653 [Pirellula staleyi DSM 6068]|uniref:Uncharacterized protein n=1 Tax=Pirellula staleyi (strain ATCC 27377 / DSM 6068 / ICPB 4128) TaxID=530564 RepID=D2R580_PIRSD|nr:hypothetical protein [Pirellula staleyi]ADB15339.1 hypothetical protein Psta_0653 [Pirellula staleyi DSM 6068]
MAKKKSVKKVGGDDASLRSPRKEPYSSQKITGVQERIREQATRFAALARAMDDSKIDAIDIDGHAMLMRGLNQIDNFLDNASRAVREAKVAKSQS